jgi:ubiquinone/menaquinone biosynthesis C-methylase UbiE
MRPWIQIEKIPEVLAPSYAKAARLVVERFYRKIAAELLSIFKAGSILDLGTGPGYLPIEIAKLSPAIHIVGIDLSEKLIRIARTNAAKAGLSSQLSFEIGNAARLRFQEASFDMVISTGMLHSLKDPVTVFKEIHRLLKKDATAWILDPASVASLINQEEWWASLSMRDRCFLKLFKALGLHRPIKPYKRNQITPMIQAAGFQRYTIDETADEIKIVLQK